MGALSWTQA